MNIIQLTVQSCGNGNFRLGINTSDSLKIFKCRHKKVKLILDNQEILTKTSCGTPCLSEIPLKDKKYKKGFDLYHKDLDKWINRNNFYDYVTGQPTKLIFELLETKDILELKYINKL